MTDNIKILHDLIREARIRKASDSIGGPSENAVAAAAERAHAANQRHFSDFDHRRTGDALGSAITFDPFVKEVGHPLRPSLWPINKSSAFGPSGSFALLSESDKRKNNMSDQEKARLIANILGDMGVVNQMSQIATAISPLLGKGSTKIRNLVKKELKGRLL